ncbi:phosphotransferase family protein [Terrabacter sp. MAHUQ-38]|uniref:phosphotransferase family protein n=1 Tax=unclassified Terrabacter TaxID=2630222 RepID=UPI00165E60C7|nr:phosphotransferase [Terrabacter sp. MAHUQ-38]MBC9822414.1 phosphotransferase [Terrabacter sp. MAHUQ-38]
MTNPAVLDAGLGDLLDAVLRDHLGPHRGRLVVLAMSKDENPKATIIAFPPKGRTPLLAVKVALTTGARAAVAAEARALQQLAEGDPTLVGGTVPRLLDVRHDAAGAVMVTTAHEGVPMSIDYHRWRHTSSARAVQHDFECAGTWLDSLADAGLPPGHVQSPTAIGNAVGTGCGTAGSIARALVARWPSDASAHALAEHVTSIASDLSADRPASVVHGDFWCGNILRRDGAVAGVIDWEHATFIDDPLRDRARFALSYALYLDRHTTPGRRVAGHRGLVAGPWGEGVRYAFAGSGWLPDLMRRFVSDGLQATGRDPGLWREVLLLGLAEIAATSDHGDFAHHHLSLGAELLSWP